MVGAPCWVLVVVVVADSDREAGWGCSLRTAWGQQQPERDTPPPFPSKSHLQPLHHPRLHLTVKTTAPVASQAPSPLLDLRSFLSSHHPPLHLPPPPQTSSPLVAFLLCCSS
ncbi:hypothetical protein CesoFtcFv8_018296 [Champsocephalus esox]|uniref:Secreted protein n=1 Tax=Champsocephalus esox TaxID=159716 RepID=A0AAN8GME0_9TELE|nr:hypothetical protein CesoFtcFv8_018296 [Champsocephalus esox]